MPCGADALNGRHQWGPSILWSLFNAFTGVYREINPHTAMRRGEALHGLFDAVVGMS